MQERIEAYDFIRSAAILLVFFGHILGNQITNGAVSLMLRSLSPGLTMSLLGFISAALLSAREHDSGAFLIKRFSRTSEYGFDIVNHTDHNSPNFLNESNNFFRRPKCTHLITYLEDKCNDQYRGNRLRLLGA